MLFVLNNEMFHHHLVAGVHDEKAAWVSAQQGFKPECLNISLIASFIPHEIFVFIHYLY